MTIAPGLEPAELLALFGDCGALAAPGTAELSMGSELKLA